jgi:hypothetical protein
VANFFTGGKYDAVVTTAWTEGDFNYDAQADILDIADFFGTSLFDAGPYLASAGNPAAARARDADSSSAGSRPASAIASAFASLSAEPTTASIKKKVAFASFR